MKNTTRLLAVAVVLMVAFIYKANAMHLDDSIICWDHDHMEATTVHGYVVTNESDKRVDYWRFIDRLTGMVLQEGDTMDNSGDIATTNRSIKLRTLFRVLVDKGGWTFQGSDAQEWVYIKAPGDGSYCQPDYYWLLEPKVFFSSVSVPVSSRVTFRHENGTPVVGAQAYAFGPNSNDTYEMNRVVTTDRNGLAKLAFPSLTHQYQTGIQTGGYIFKGPIMTGSNTQAYTGSVTIPNNTTFTTRKMGRPITNAGSAIYSPATGRQISDYQQATDTNGRVVYNYTENEALLGLQVGDNLIGFGPFAKGQEHTVVAVEWDRPVLYSPEDYFNYNSNSMIFYWEDISSTPKHLDYELRIFQNGNPVFAMPFSQNAVQINDFPAGLFTWQVWAWDTEDFTYAISEEFLFGCRYGVSRSASVGTTTDVPKLKNERASLSVTPTQTVSFNDGKPSIARAISNKKQTPIVDIMADTKAKEERKTLPVPYDFIESSSSNN